MKKLLIIMSLILVSCGSDEKIETKENNKPTWNLEEELKNDFWGAVNALEARGTNLTKFRVEDIDLAFVDEIGDGNDNTVAMARKIWGDGIKIDVLRSKWFKPTTEAEQLENKITMLHEIGHDYFNLAHYDNEWDIMNPSNTPDKVITDQDVNNSIDRMLMEGRVIYDSLSLRKRF